MNGIIRIEIGNPNIPPTAVNGNTAPNSAAGTYLGTSQSPMKALMKSPIRCITNRTRAYHQSSPNWSLIFLKNFTATAYHNHTGKAIQNNLIHCTIHTLSIQEMAATVIKAQDYIGEKQNPWFCLIKGSFPGKQWLISREPKDQDPHPRSPPHMTVDFNLSHKDPGMSR